MQITEKARNDGGNWDKYKSLKIIIKIIIPFWFRDLSKLKKTEKNSKKSRTLGEKASKLKYFKILYIIG